MIASFNDKAKDLLEYLVADDPEIEYRIENGIEQNRKGFGTIELFDNDENPIKGAKIHIKQRDHEFHFGCNAFMIDQFPDESQNSQYEDVFSELFNLAVVPFYWSDIEPQDGILRFNKNSNPIYRRPPPDRVLEFCDKYEVIPKGHPLLWHCFRPNWLTCDEKDMKERIDRHFWEIANRYANKIKIWDVCNEAQTIPTYNEMTGRGYMPQNHVELAFTLAKKYFPDAVKTYNDNIMWYRFSRNYSPVYLMIRMLLAQGYNINALGLQLHMFEHQLKDAKYFLNPNVIYQCLDLYGKLNIPINFSEVSIIGRHDLGDGDEFQRIVTEKLYRLWFSHNAVNGIIWWNLVDGTAAYAPLGSEEGENSIRAGLVNYDFTPKPAYLTLQRFIKKEWMTDTTMNYIDKSTNKFRGFFGNYELKIETETGNYRRQIYLAKNSLNLFKLKLA